LVSASAWQSLDLDAITAWLQSHGFRVNVVYPQWHAHRFLRHRRPGTHCPADGNSHISMSKVRSTLAISAIHEFPPHSLPLWSASSSLHDFSAPYQCTRCIGPRPQFTFPDPSGGTAYAARARGLGQDLQFKSALQRGYFRPGPRPSCSLKTPTSSTLRTGPLSRRPLACPAILLPLFASGAPRVFPPVPIIAVLLAPLRLTTPKPILDAEWASASAPSAAIEMAACGQHRQYLRRP